MNFAELENAISGLLEADDSEWSEEDKKAYEEYITSLAILEQEKVDRTGYMIQLELARADALEEYGKRQIEKARSIRKRIDNLKSYVVETMRKNGIKKIKGMQHTFSIRETEVAYPKIDDATLFPEEFQRRKEIVELNKISLKAYLKDHDGVLIGKSNAGPEVTLAVLVKKPSLIIK